MKIFEYKNISKTLIVIIITIILSNTLLISLVYYNSQIKEFETNFAHIQEEKIKKQKEKTKNDIIFQVVMLKFKYENNISKHKNEIIKYLQRIPFDKEKSDYIFVYELLNKNGGDNFAKMLLNPNRKDLEGKLISTNYMDVNNFAFRKKFLEDINTKGESFVRYAYKKTNNTLDEKISYFYYFKELNWIIAKGIYIEDIQKELYTQKQNLKQQLLKIIQENILLYIFFTLLMVIITYYVGKKVQSILKDKEKKVKATTKELAKLNRNLDVKIKEEIEKNKEQERLLTHKSKFIALGEMISLIAHQWRQPISEIAAIIMNIQMHQRVGKLDTDILTNKTKQIEDILSFMSQTIDDFRCFFKPNKQAIHFNISESINRVIKITKPMLDEYNIKLTKDIDTTLRIITYQNELEQVLLNIITNAKDALVQDNIKNPKLFIRLYSNKDTIYINICDNAKGIQKEIQEKIFEPYFTTKDEANGTGIGLYMSKIIVEKNLKGSLELESSSEGTCFSIIM